MEGTPVLVSPAPKSPNRKAKWCEFTAVACGYHWLYEIPVRWAEGLGGLRPLFSGPKYPLHARSLAKCKSPSLSGFSCLPQPRTGPAILCPYSLLLRHLGSRYMWVGTWT